MFPVCQKTFQPKSRIALHPPGRNVVSRSALRMSREEYRYPQPVSAEPARAGTGRAPDSGGIDFRRASEAKPASPAAAESLCAVPQRFQESFVVAPVLFHLDPQLKKNLRPQKALHLLAGQPADFLQH